MHMCTRARMKTLLFVENTFYCFWFDTGDGETMSACQEKQRSYGEQIRNAGTSRNAVMYAVRRESHNHSIHCLRLSD